MVVDSIYDEYTQYIVVSGDRGDRERSSED
jgi:hypothetical protein